MPGHPGLPAPPGTIDPPGRPRTSAPAPAAPAGYWSAGCACPDTDRDIHRCQVTGQRQRGAKRVAGIREMDSVEVPATLPLGELAHRCQVLAPILTAYDEHGKGLARKQLSRFVRLQERANRHAHGLPPCR